MIHETGLSLPLAAQEVIIVYARDRNLDKILLSLMVEIADILRTLCYN